MNLQQLTSIINNASLYTETTVAFAKTIKQQKLTDEQTQQEEKVTEEERIETIIRKAWQKEAEYLIWLTTISLNTLAGNPNIFQDDTAIFNAVRSAFLHLEPEQKQQAPMKNSKNISPYFKSGVVNLLKFKL